MANIKKQTFEIMLHVCQVALPSPAINKQVDSFAEQLVKGANGKTEQQMTLKFFYESRGLLKSGKVYWEQWTFNFSIQEKSQQGYQAYRKEVSSQLTNLLSAISLAILADEDHIPLQSKGIPLTIKDEQPFMFEVVIGRQDAETSPLSVFGRMAREVMRS